MNENLEKQVAAILEKGMALAEQTGEFVIEQGGDLLKEFYMWHTASYVLGIILCVIFSIALHLFIRFFARRDDDDFVYIFESVQIVPLMFLGTNIYNLVYISIAPKLYLIEYFIK